MASQLPPSMGSLELQTWPIFCRPHLNGVV